MFSDDICRYGYSYVYICSVMIYVGTGIAMYIVIYIDTVIYIHI